MTMLRAHEKPLRRAALDDDVDIVRDRTLVLAAQAGDCTAFDDLFARYHRRLWRSCMKRLKDEHDAEDVVQEAFVRAWRTLPSFAGERRFYPWLSVIASHLCSNLLRRRNRCEPVGAFPEKYMVSWEFRGEDAVLGSFESNVVARAFANLSPRHRQILLLREVRGWSYQRIADHEGVPVSTVESLLWRARLALKREFAKQSGENQVIGLAGAITLAVRRWFRWVHVAVERGSTVAPVAGPVVMGSAAVAATAVAAVVGSIIPGPSALAASGHPSLALFPTFAGPHGSVLSDGGGPCPVTPSSACLPPLPGGPTPRDLVTPSATKTAQPPASLPDPAPFSPVLTTPAPPSAPAPPTVGAPSPTGVTAAVSSVVASLPVPTVPSSPAAPLAVDVPLTTVAGGVASPDPAGTPSGQGAETLVPAIPS